MNWTVCIYVQHRGKSRRGGREELADNGVKGSEVEGPRTSCHRSTASVLCAGGRGEPMVPGEGR
jgi:hypothetical protein